MKKKYFQKNIRKFLHPIMMLMITSFFACDPKPVDYLDQDAMFASVDRLEQGVLGVYEPWYPEYTTRISSLITDETLIGDQNVGFDAVGQSIYRWTFSSDEDDILAPWQNGYQVIGRVNKILKGIDNVPTHNQSEEEKRDGLKGELLAVRAYVHFDLYRVYGYSGAYLPESLAVPYMKVSETSSKPSRPTTKSFFTDLLSDLKEAEYLQPKDGDIRMGITAIQALCARVALYAENYADAVNYATKVIDKIPLTPISNFSGLWSDQLQGEIIFKLKRSNVNVIRPGDLFFSISSDKLLFSASEKLQNQYQEDDIRFSTWFDQENEEADMYIKKYAGTEANPNLNDVKMFRSSEMYLIRSEARLKLGDMSMAQQDLNRLRTNRIDNYEDETFNNQEKLLEAILNERYKEFPYEGQRYFDLKRLGLPIERGDRELNPNSTHYYIPIPQSEVMANPNIRPNNMGW